MTDTTKTKVEPPSTFIWKKISEYGWSQNDFATVAGISLKHVNEILNNKKHITLDTAKILEKVFGEPVFYWIKLDIEYRLYQESLAAEIDADVDISERSKIYKYNPVSEMVRRGWISKSKKAGDLKKEILKFWSIDSLDFRFLDKEINTNNALYKKGYGEGNPYYTHVWFKMVKEKSKSLPIKKFDKSKLNDLLSTIANYTRKPESIKEFLFQLNEAGVKFLVFPHLKQTYINGAAFLEGQNPVIVVTLRYDRIDHFWFVLLHELGHVLHHRDLLKAGHVELEQAKGYDEKEEEADKVAAQYLHYPEILNTFSGRENIQELDIERFARELNLHLSIVKGALAFYKLIPYNRIHSGNFPVSRSIPEEYILEKKERGRK